MIGQGSIIPNAPPGSERPGAAILEELEHDDQRRNA